MTRTPNRRFGSDAIVDVTKSLGFKYATLNPGASIRGIHDSIVNYGGNKSPELIECLHEEIAVSIASGYYRATQKPLLVLLHDVEGLLHAPRAIFDAWLERDAMLIIGGNGPLDIEKRRPGIDWIHTAALPNNVVRNYVKWDDQPIGLAAAAESILRGYQIATTKPAGPVYLSMDAGLQEEELAAEFRAPRPQKYSSPEIGEGSSEALKTLASLLLGAENPVVITGRYGRGAESVRSLVRLVEILGAAFLDTGLRFNFPSQHPQNLTGDEESLLSSADLVVALDVNDLYKELVTEGSHFKRGHRWMTRSECQVVRVDLEAASASGWVGEAGRLTPVSLSILGDGPAAVASLQQMCGKKIATLASMRRRIKERRARLAERSRELHRNWLKTAETAAKGGKVSAPSLSFAMWRFVKEKDWSVVFPGYTLRGINVWLRRIWEIAEPHQYPGRSGATGVGIGRAIGGAMAHPGKLCIDFQPDGDLLYSPSALWTLAHYKIPMLIVMLNNRSYYNDEAHQAAVASERGRPVKTSGIGTKITEPNVDFVRLANSYGVAAVGPIESITSLEAHLGPAVDEVLKRRRPFLLDTVILPE